MDGNICDIGTANLTLVLAGGTPQPVNSSMLRQADGRGSPIDLESGLGANFAEVS